MLFNVGCAGRVLGGLQETFDQLDGPVVVIGQSRGGSLAKVLDSISDTIRERVRIEGDIRGLTAQQRYSAYILSLLPVSAAVALLLFSPDYVAPLFAPGPLRLLLIAAGVMVFVGFLIMQRMAKIDV